MSALPVEFRPRRSSPRAPLHPNDWRRAVDALPEHVALLDGDWNIVAVNLAWERAATRGGYEALREGGNYRAAARNLAAAGHKAACAAARAIDEFDAGTRDRFRIVYAGEGASHGRTYETIITAHNVDGDQLITITRNDLTQLYKLRAQRRQLGNSLLKFQEQERRRIARDLHDSTSQLLVGLHLHMARLKRDGQAVEPGFVSEIEQIIDRVQKEIRSFAFLAHPPPLTELGLVEALRELAAGFARRTGLSVEFDSDRFGAPPPEAAQGAFYRLAQEALANIHRHSHARRVRMSLIRKVGCSHLLISDDGVGLRAAAIGSGRYGVGLLGMRERLRDVGGRLSIVGSEIGTTLIASAPHHQAE